MARHLESIPRMHGDGTSYGISFETEEVFVRQPDLLPQLNLYLEMMLKGARRTEQELQLVRNVVGGYMVTRFERGRQLRSEKLKIARSITQQYFNEEVGDDVDVEFDLCMDRRTRKTLMLGVPGAFGTSQRYPGGKPEGFLRVGVEGKLKLDPDSNYGRHTAKSLQKNRFRLLVVDSHYGCAARIDIEENKTGITPKDSGVNADRKYKGEMVNAIREFAEDFDCKTIFVRTSFDPHTGYLSLLDEDNFEKEVVSTKDIARSLRNVFSPRHEFKIDWLGDYENSAFQFWAHIRDMKSEALPIVKGELRKVYPHLERQDSVQFNMKARVALLSAYSGWLNNFRRKYSHDVHNESLVVATIGGDHGPFANYEAFEIAVDSPVIREDALYASRLVRKVRGAGNAHGLPSDPVPLIVQAKTEITDRSEIPSVSDLCIKISEDLLSNPRWRNFTFEDLVTYVCDLENGGEQYRPSLDFGISIAKHILTMRGIYDPTHPFYEYIYSGSIIPVSVVVDQNKTPIAVLRVNPI